MPPYCIFLPAVPGSSYRPLHFYKQDRNTLLSPPLTGSLHHQACLCGPQQSKASVGVLASMIEACCSLEGLGPVTMTPLQPAQGSCEDVDCLAEFLGGKAGINVTYSMCVCSDRKQELRYVLGRHLTRERIPQISLLWCIK